MSTNGNGRTGKGDATRSRSAIRAGLLLSACLLFASAPESLAQTPQQRARIDYEAAKLALEQNLPGVALEKLEKVIETLGPLPDLHALAAEAALQAKKRDVAKKHLDAAFAASDAAFEKTPEFKKLVQVAARLELDDPAQEAKRAEEKGYWVDPSTKLMWTVKDNGSQISGNDAIRWCDNLVLAGHGDWRQPSIDELAGIYDPSITEKGKPKIKAPIRLS